MQTIQGYGLLLLLLVAGFGADWSRAQSYPTKPIRIQTLGIGGGSDIVARLVTPELSAALGQPVVIENRASGTILGSYVAKAAPDGYTLMVYGGAFWIASLFGDLPYDPVRDFATISMLARSPSVLVVHPSLPARSVAELIKLAKARPGELNYATGGTGSATHILGELFKFMANVDIVRITYKAQSQESTDLMSGQVQMAFGAGTTWTPLIKAGKVRALATAGLQRSVLLPDLPTVAETLPGFVSESLFAMWAPAKTPDAIVRRLNQETVRVLERPDVRERLLKAGLEPAGGTPEQLADTIKSELERLTKVFKAVGLKSVEK